MSVVVSEVEAVLFRVRYVPTAEIARDRLRQIVRTDRAACGDGRWELSGINLSGFYLESCLMKKEHVSFHNKPRCRWVQRA